MFVCNTYYQLLVAIQMRSTIFSNEKAYLVLSNDIKNVEQISSQIKATNKFDGVYFYDIKKRNKLTNFIFAFIGKNICDFPKSLVVDEPFSFNFDLSFHFIFAFFERRNHNIQSFRFEEGVLSYFVPFDKSNFLRKVYKLRKFFKKRNARAVCSQFYCFRPELYDGVFEAVGIPTLDISNSELKSTLINSFNLNTNSHSNTSESLVIYLASVYNIDGDGKVDEHKIVSDVERITDPLPVKVKNHPRDNCNTFKNIFEFNDAPIELLPLCFNDFSKIIVLSSFSGSLLNIASLYGGTIKCIYTTMLCDCSRNALASHFSAIIKKLCHEPFFENKIKLVADINELECIFKKILLPELRD